MSLNPAEIEWFKVSDSIAIEFSSNIEYEIFGEGSQISTNQKRENSAFSLLIG